MVEILSSLSDNEVIAQLSQLVKTEKEITEKVVRHFAEVERRRLYLELGYGNLFDYATRGLGYSNAAAMRRINAARVGLQAPEVFECLEKGELNLSTIEKFAPLKKKHEASGLVEQFKGKTSQEAEEIAALLNPVAQSEIRDRIKVVSVKAPEVDPRQASLGAEGRVLEESTWFRSEVNSKEENEVAAEKVYHVSFAANEEFMKQLERAKELNSRGNKDDLALQSVLGKALGEYLKRRCPKEREARRRARRERRAAANDAPEIISRDTPAGVTETTATFVEKADAENALEGNVQSFTETARVDAEMLKIGTADEVVVPHTGCSLRDLWMLALLEAGTEPSGTYA